MTPPPPLNGLPNMPPMGHLKNWDITVKINRLLEDYSLTFQAKKWIELFTSLAGVADGYGKCNVTPYMHAMVYHAPTLLLICPQNIYK